MIVTRNAPNKAIKKNIIDLWSGQRVCIIVLTDDDLKEMVGMYDDKQRFPYEYLKKKYIDQHRLYPS